MSNSEPPRENLARTTSRLPFEPKPFGSAMQQGAILLYAALTIGLAGLAFYMAAVERLPLMSGYVAAPAIGALWFGLRLLMVLSKR